MIEPNDQQNDRKTRARRRKSVGWKSGVVLTGLGAVVLGAGYLAGVNAPAVAQTNAQVAQSQSRAAQSQLLAPQTNGAVGDGQSFQFGGSDDQPSVSGSAGENGTFVLRGDDAQPLLGGSAGTGAGSNSSGTTDQFGQQFGGRRSRQRGGFSQQQPNFAGPITRSRGS